MLFRNSNRVKVLIQEPGALPSVVEYCLLILVVCIELPLPFLREILRETIFIALNNVKGVLCL